jgi:hypothetical protein
LISAHTVGPADTWFGLLIGGLAGSVVGGLVTFGAVWLTIRHERQLRSDDHLDTAVGAAYGAAGRLMANFLEGRMFRRSGLPVYQDFSQQVATATTVAQRTCPPLADLLQAASLELTNAMNAFVGGTGEEEDVYRACVQVHVALGSWIAQPQKIKDGLIGFDSIQRITADVVSSPTSRANAPARPRRTRPWRRRH